MVLERHLIIFGHLVPFGNPSPRILYNQQHAYVRVFVVSFSCRAENPPRWEHLNARLLEILRLKAAEASC